MSAESGLHEHGAGSCCTDRQGARGECAGAVFDDGEPVRTAPTLAGVAPQAGEPVVSTRANKFTGTNLEELLKQKKAETLVIVGSAANGAVMYTSFHANTRGFTVVVAEDGISSPAPINTVLARYQLLNQPGFINAANTPLADKKVTLSRGDLITFR